MKLNASLTKSTLTGGYVGWSGMLRRIIYIICNTHVTYYLYVACVLQIM